MQYVSLYLVSADSPIAGWLEMSSRRVWRALIHRFTYIRALGVALVGAGVASFHHEMFGLHIQSCEYCEPHLYTTCTVMQN